MTTFDGGRVARGNEREARSDLQFNIVHCDAVRFFPELVAELGADPYSLLRKARVDSAVFTKRGSILEYGAMIRLFELAASELRCPDFGMKLAALQGGTRVMGPIGVAMKNSKTLGQALGYCARQIQAYSPATRVRFVPDRGKQELFVGLEILLDGIAAKSQVIEHAMLLASLNAIDITGATARVRRVCFRHEPLSPLRVYQTAFGCEVEFGANADGILFSEQDLMCSVLDPDEQLYEMATEFIASHYPPGTPPMHARVRALVNRYLGTAECTSERVATELCMHPRTLQRRLKSEGKTFESIKDEVRREVAMRYLNCSDMPLTKVAAKLGYAEQSVLSRSCYRWFAASPSALREKSAAGRDEAG